MTYHFYAFPGRDTTPVWGGGTDSLWPVDRSKKGRAVPVQLPVGEWPVHLFKMAARFTERAAHVNAIVRNGTFGGGAVQISVNEVGVIGGALCPSGSRPPIWPE